MKKKIEIKILKLVTNLIKSDNHFWRKFTENFSAALLGTSGSSAINLLTLLLMVRYMGSENYAFFVIAQQYMLVVGSFVNFQSWQAIIKFGSLAIVESDYGRLASIFKLGFVIDFISAVLGALFALILVPYIGHFFSWSDGQVLISSIFVVELAFRIEGTPTGILRLLDKFKYTAIHAVITALLRLLVIWFYLSFFRLSLLNFVVIYVVLDIIRYVSLLLIAAVEVSRSIGLRNVIKSRLKLAGKEMLEFTIWSNIGLTADLPIKYFDVFFISRVSLELVAVYKVFKQILQTLSLLTGPVAQVIMPQLSNMIARGEHRLAYSAILKIRNVILIILTPVTVISFFIAQPLLLFVLGPEYSQNTNLFIALFILSDYTLAYVGLHPLFAAFGKVKEDFFIILSSNIIYLILAIGLIDIFSIYGIIIASAVQYIMTIVAKTLIIRRYLDKSYTMDLQSST